MKVGNWSTAADPTAAGGARISNTDQDAAKISTAAASPANYFEMSFNASAGTPYRLWIRGRTLNNSPYNDSVFVQFSGSVTSGGSAVYRIGTTSATEYNLEDCSGCTVSAWGWQDNGWGVGVLGPQIYFQSTGTQTIRIQVREDGLSIDQIVLSPSLYLFTAPGPLKNDNTILPQSGGGSPSPTPTPTPGGGESANNTRTPPATQIVDSAGAVWTRTSSGTILRNGQGTSGAGSQILYCNRTVYAFGTDSQWYRWNNGWTAVGVTDPCDGSTPAPTPPPTAESPNNTRLPPSTQIVDSAGASWTRTSSGTILRNGQGTSGAGSQVLYCNRIVYAFGTDSQWYRWSNGWSAIGSADPCGGGSPAPTPTPTPTPTPPPPPSGGNLRVLSWNVAFGKGTDNVRDFDRIAAYIANMNPDLIGLCEMPSEFINTLVPLLNQRTGRTWFWHFLPKYEGTTEGNLILSKYSFSSTGGRYLSVQRSVAQVTVNVGGRTINFFATHLDDGSSGNRYTQAGELLAFMSGYSESKIVVGDFNAGPDLSETVRMTSAFYDSWMRAMNAGTAAAYPDNTIGMHTRTRRGRIDYVYYSLSSSLSLTGTQIPDTRNLNQTNVSVLLGTPDDWGVRPSDHNPMIANFQIQ
ncbi:MAG TPA: endonuclease/exonuclease/phosphatase family protein [Pyrinomonadaceae bacterium]|nr:endonuclease/exonuclease/phosphatase family protein [Pyrinomonadaceae bacterium]